MRRRLSAYGLEQKIQRARNQRAQQAKLRAAGWILTNVWAPKSLHEEVKRRAAHVGAPLRTTYLAAVEAGLHTLSISALISMLRRWRELVSPRPPLFKKGEARPPRRRKVEA